MKNGRWLILFLATLCLTMLVQTDEMPASARQNRTFGLYELVQIRFDIASSFNNPYDPAEVNVNATFISPDGTSVRVPAYYVQEYEDACAPELCESERLQPTGEARWEVRFTPTSIGEWLYRIGGTVGGEAINIDEGNFRVEQGDRTRGFIRIAENNRYFEFDDGTPYFPVGQNLGWSWEGGGGLYQYIEWLDKLAASGANYARINVDVPWFTGIEWSSPPGQYNDAGQLAAHRLDEIVEAAEERGIYLHVSLIWHQAFREYTGLPVNVPSAPPRPAISADFDNHPYNSTLGGNMTGAGDILFNSLAQSWLQRRLRYMMARYSYSTAIFSWELVDEFDRIAAFVAERDLEWLARMRSAVRDNDPNDHLISTGTRSYLPVIQNSEVVDFSQVKLYQSRPVEASSDQVQLTFAAFAEVRAATDKPILMQEFSLNPWFEPAEDDPTGTHVRNTIWAAMMNGAAGAAMPYWWDTYIDPQDLYPIYSAASYFSQGVRWNELNLVPFEPALALRGTVEYQPLLVDDFNPMFRSASLTNAVYQLTADGASPPTSLMSSYLYGQQFNTANTQPESFIITPPVDTSLTVSVRSVSPSADARLEILIDERVALQIDLSAGTDSTSFSIPLEAGSHNVTLNNTGEDWLQLESIEIANYRAPLRSYAMLDTEIGVALVWIHHRDYTWESVAGEIAIEPEYATLTLPDMPAGNYIVEFWDPFSGNIIGEELLTMTEDRGAIAIDLLPVNRQLALRVLRVAGASN